MVLLVLLLLLDPELGFEPTLVGGDVGLLLDVVTENSCCES